MEGLKVSLEIKADGRVFKFDNINNSKNNYLIGKYNLKVKRGKHLEYSFSRGDEKEINIERYKINVNLPLQSISQVIAPECGREYTETFFPLYLWRRSFFINLPIDGHPFMSLLDGQKQPYFSFGIIGGFRETRFTCVRPGANKKNTLVASNILEIEIERPYEKFKWGETKVLKEMLFMDESNKTWFHAFREYTDIYRKWLNVETEIPKLSAYEPVWCTWTAFFSKLNDKKIIKNAVIAKKLGLKSIIIDDGWYGPGLDEEKGNRMGDFYPDKKKFTDFNKMIKTIQKMGLKAILWIAPHGIAPISKKVKTYGHLFVKLDGKNFLTRNGYHTLCPCNKEAREYVVKESVRLLKDYRVDGLKIDLFNNYTNRVCESNHSHDCSSMIEGLHLMMKDIWEAMKAYNPEVILELKQNYGNVLTEQYGSMVRAGDTPFDIDLDLWRCFYIQAYARVIHNDYLAWTPSEKPLNLAVMMIKLITAGVPTFSSALTGVPKSHLEVIKKWMTFYNDHLWLLKEKREPQVGDMSVWQIKTSESSLYSLVFTAQLVELESNKQIIILNGTRNEKTYIKTANGFISNAEFYDYKCNLVNKSKLKIYDGVSLPVSPGGYVVLKRK
ncbi:MAG: hypothetical protein A2252_06935 [Elusimicrobia bacterium RIFOXYA2_FULL_39_19]|nr:MAG: hypothetical protein A2252_06935 [Elusimicrobia bacterium RIFOXYA2_FULL_39_19]